MSATWRLIQGDCREALRSLPAGSVQTCVTSPPYYALRDYGTAEWEGGDAACEHYQGRNGAGRADGRVDERGQRNRDGTTALTSGVCSGCGARRVDRQVGLEATPDEYVAGLVEVFREVRRVLRDDGTVWLNLGDSYAANRGYQVPDSKHTAHDFGASNAAACPPGCKPKDLIGIPWAVAFALRADGWYLRSEIIWAKPNPMPESVLDRPTRSHEQIFLLSKNKTYFYDADAIREALADTNAQRTTARYDTAERYGAGNGGNGGLDSLAARMRSGEHAGRNKRSVWTVTTKPFPGAHFATFPPGLIEPCVLAGSAPWACGECGAPWQRVVERGEAVASTRGEQSWTGVTGQRDNPGGGVGNLVPISRTVDWAPTCEHHDRSGTSVVLDPFAGSGTTGMVAMRHGRSFVGCELNAEYVELARRRIADDAPLFNTFAEA